MKTIFFFVLVLGLAPIASTMAQEDRAARIQMLYQQGLDAIRDGEVEVARGSFAAVLELDPRHANARYQLKQVSLDAGKLEVRKRELAFSRILIPEVNLDGASLDEALEALTAIVHRESKGDFVTNFILRDPDGTLNRRKISVQLRNVPANVVLRYIAEQSGAVVRFDKHAIIIRKPSAATVGVEES